MRRENHDPYAPPPRHKEKSGAVVRFAIIAALLGAAAWGYMEYSQQPQTALVGPENQQVADAGDSATYQPIPPAASRTPSAAPATTESPETPPAPADTPSEQPPG